MWLHTSCNLTFDIEVPTPFVLMLRPQSGGQQWIASEEYRIEPSVPIYEFIDNYGNFAQRIIAPPGHFAIFTSAEVKTSDYIDRAPGAEFVEIQNLPDNVLSYLLPSRYCESDTFSLMANEITAGVKLGYDQVTAIVEWLRDRIRFEPNRTNIPISAKEVNNRGWGVCRDFSHLGIALCRSLSIPARMVVGYLYELKPMDLHAWFEVYVGDRWYAFDATQIEMKGGYVALGYGRDAADVAIYNQFGPALQPISQQINVEQINRPDRTPYATL